MIQRYQGQQAQWRLSFVSDSEKAMTLTPGDEPCTWTVHVGSSDELTPERLRRAAAKAVNTFAKASKKAAYKAGILDGATLTPEKITALGDLPSREVLLATLLGTINAAGSALARVIQAYVDKENGGSEETPAAE